MTYKDSTPTFNTNRRIVNFKDYIQHEPHEKAELKKMKRQYKKVDQVKQVDQDHMYKYNRVTHKNDDLVKPEVEDKLDALEEDLDSEIDRERNEEEILDMKIETSVGNRYLKRLLVKTNQSTYYVDLQRIAPTTKF